MGQKSDGIVVAIRRTLDIIPCSSQKSDGMRRRRSRLRWWTRASSESESTWARYGARRSVRRLSPRVRLWPNGSGSTRCGYFASEWPSAYGHGWRNRLRRKRRFAKRFFARPTRTRRIQRVRTRQFYAARSRSGIATTLRRYAPCRCYRHGYGI